MRIVYRNKKEIINPVTGFIIPSSRYFTLIIMSSDSVRLGLYSMEKYVSFTVPREISDNVFERVGIFL